MEALELYGQNFKLSEVQHKRITEDTIYRA
jgi:hypothetical protein